VTKKQRTKTVRLTVIFEPNRMKAVPLIEAYETLLPLNKMFINSFKKINLNLKEKNSLINKEQIT
jgi:hypothetical protein